MDNFIKMPATPRGEFRFPALNEPDTTFGTKKGDPDKDAYKTGLVLAEEDAAELIEELEAKLEEGYEAMCRKEGKKKLKRCSSLPWGPVIDKVKDDDGMEEEVERDGFIELRFKKKARTKKGVEQRPALYDAAKNPLNRKTNIIGGGSVGRVSYQLYFWYNSSLGFGMTLDLQGVQVLELKSWGGGDCANDFDEEEGFEADLSAVASDDDGPEEF